MAATNPFRVSDLIAKYGWKVMPYLSNLGPMLLAEAQVLFVDSEHINATDADDTEHGHSFEKPLATIDYAIGLCTAAERSVILVAPGHVETLAAATVDFDVSDITCIGIGEGSNRPKVVYGHANSSVDIGANNVHLINLRFVPSITNVVIGVDIETGKTGTIIENCEFAEGDDIAADEFITALAVKATCTDTRVTNCLFRTGLAADGTVEAIKLTGISDNVIIEKSRFIGNWSTAGIYNDSGVCTDLLIDDCTMKVANGSVPGISVVGTTTGIIRNVCIESTGLAVDSMIVAADMAWFNNYGVTADGTAAEIIGGGEVQAALVTYNLDHLAAIDTGVNAGSDMSGFVVDGSILGHIMATDANPDTYSAATDSLQAIRDYIAGTTALDAINLDHLALTLDDEGVYPTSVADDTILAKILSKGDPAAASSYSNTTDSLEMLSDKIGAFSGDGEAAEDDSIKALLDLIKTDAETIITDTGTTLPAELAKIKDQAVGSSITYFVDSEASDDSGTGLSWATAKATIQAAVDLVTDYDTIYIRGTGGFTETVATATDDVGVKIIGIGDGKINPLWTSEAVDEAALTINGQNWEVHNILFHAGGETKTVAMIQVDEEGSNLGSGSVIENCYFHGGDVSDQAVCYHGGSIQNKLLNNHITAFGGTCTAEEAAVCGGSYVQSWCDGEVRGNVFTNNTKHLRLQSGNSLFKDNIFESQGSVTSATTIINLVSSGVSVGYNTVVGNTFGDDSSELSPTNGYYFSTTDIVAGNHCPDGDSAGKPAGEGKAWYVDSVLGVATNSGLSWGRALKTIQAAVTLAGDYDTIYVRGETAFEETVTTLSTQMGCKLIGVGDGKTNPNWTSSAVGANHLIMAGPNWEVSGFLFSGSAQTVPYIHVAMTANGTVIRDNYFHGGGNSLSAVQFYGAPPQCKLLNNHITAFGRANTSDQAAVFGNYGTMSAVDYEIIGNWFSENTDHLRMQLGDSLIKSNVFQAEGIAVDATIHLDTVCGGESCGGNCVVDNYFGDTSANIKNTAGYYGTAADMWSGNHALDSDDWGAPTAA